MNTKNLIGGLLAGAAIGVAIGLLLAPSSGKKTIENLKQGSRKLSDGIKETAEESIALLKERYNAGVDEVVKKGRETINHVSDRIKA